MSETWGRMPDLPWTGSLNMRYGEECLSSFLVVSLCLVLLFLEAFFVKELSTSRRVFAGQNT